MGSPKVAHLTSVHTRFDNRIFVKMCRSLAAAGYKTSLVVADGLGDGMSDGVRLIDVGKPPGGRLSRIRGAPKLILSAAVGVDADVYHMHDPELISVGVELKRRGKKVVFDSHEDVPADILTKQYIPGLLRYPVSRAFALYERMQCRKFDAIVGATPFIRDKFRHINQNSTDINNYPFLHEWPGVIDWGQKLHEVAFVGGIADIRGIRQMIDAMSYTENVRLNLVGRFVDTKVESEVKHNPAWAKVNEYGFVDRSQVGEILARSMAGLVTFLPVPNHVDAQPNKMFEYMAAGVPVVASDFPLWREIVEGNHCGICVDPLDPRAIGQAVMRLVENQDMAGKMGKNGRQAIENKYNWSNEERKLFRLYEGLVS